MKIWDAKLEGLSQMTEKKTSLIRQPAATRGVAFFDPNFIPEFMCNKKIPTAAGL